MQPGVFVLGTDTEVGKTHQVAMLLRYLRQGGLRIGAYKPVASGIDPLQDSGDPWILWDAMGRRAPSDRVCPQRFRAPLAPPQAARAEGSRVDERELRAGFDWWRSRCDWLVVEGAGGVMSPISDRMTCLDLATEFRLPVLLVVRNRLGCINAALTASQVILARGLELTGVVLNTWPDAIGEDHSLDSNAEWIGRFLPQVGVFESSVQWYQTHYSEKASGAADRCPSVDERSQ